MQSTDATIATTSHGNLSQAAHEPTEQQAPLSRTINSILNGSARIQSPRTQNLTAVSDASLRQPTRNKVGFQGQIEVIQIPLEGNSTRTFKPHRQLVDRERISIPKQAAEEALRWQLRTAQQEIVALRAQLAARGIARTKKIAGYR